MHRVAKCAWFLLLVLCNGASAFSVSSGLLVPRSWIQRPHAALVPQRAAFVDFCLGVSTRGRSCLMTATAEESSPAVDCGMAVMTATTEEPSNAVDRVMVINGICGDIEPVLASLLLRSARNIKGFDLGSVAAASKGLQIWRAVLQKGRLPIEDDFNHGEKWPQDPLFSRYGSKLQYTCWMQGC